MDYKLPARIENSNKSTYGRVLNIAGSDYMPGAAYLSSISALKMGCGYCFLASTERVIDIVATKTSNLVFLPTTKLTDKEFLKTFSNIEIGCGLSQTDSAVKIFNNVIANINQDTPLLIDADGLNILASNSKLYKERNLSKVVLTPHPKEASRLLQCSTEDILNNLEYSAIKISKDFNCITILKTNKTLVTNINGKIYKNITGNNALAKAGSGDVLAGMISGLIAQHMDIYEACCIGTYLHGLCGDIAKEKLTEYSVMAEDLISFLPEAIKQYKN